MLNQISKTIFSFKIKKHLWNIMDRCYSGVLYRTPADDPAVTDHNTFPPGHRT